MNQQQSDELKKLETTKLLMDDNTAKWTAIPALVSANGARDAHIQNLKKYRTIQDADQTGLARGKKELRKKVTDETLIVAAALVAHGALTGDTQMVDQFNYTESELKEKRDDDFIDAAEEAIAVATPILATLTGETGLTSGQLSDLVTDTANLSIGNTTPEQARNKKKIATANILEIFPVTRTQEETIVEPLMRVNFKVSDADFYNQYIESLQIVDTGHHFEDVHGIIFNPTTNENVGNVTIKILDRNNNNAEVMKLKSGDKGHYQIKELPEGNYTFKLSHPDFQSKEENVNKGEGINIKKNFAMDPL